MYKCGEFLHNCEDFQKDNLIDVIILPHSKKCGEGDVSSLGAISGSTSSNTQRRLVHYYSLTTPSFLSGQMSLSGPQVRGTQFA